MAGYAGRHARRRARVHARPGPPARPRRSRAAGARATAPALRRIAGHAAARERGVPPRPSRRCAPGRSRRRTGSAPRPRNAASSRSPTRFGSARSPQRSSGGSGGSADAASRSHPGRGGEGRARAGVGRRPPARRALRRRPRAARGRAGCRQDAARQRHRPCGWPAVPPRSVHARHAPVGPHRDDDLPRRRALVPAGTRVHERPPGRRDQPHATEDTGRAARGDGGTPGDRRG